MNKKRDNTANVPNLRFPGFEGEWEKRKLNDIATFYSGGTPLTSKREYFDGDIPFIRSGEINSKETLQFISELGLKNSSSKMVQKGDILYALYGATSGEVGISKIRGAINQAVLCIKSTENHYFIYSFLLNKKESIIRTYLQGGQGNLSAEIVKQIKLSIPTIEEQSKISRLLLLIDERTETQNKIIRELFVLKSGVSKKIFSQELRFKDENKEEFSMWKKMKLGDIAIKKSSNIAANKIEENFGKYIIYGASGVLKHVDFYEEENDYISIVKDGAGVGRIFYCKGESSVLATMDIIKPKKNLNTYFLYCLLDRINFKKYITGSTIPHIYFKDYRVEKVGVPCLEEQTKIANFLSQIDEKIETEKAILIHLESQKQYLLQQLFV